MSGGEKFLIEKMQMKNVTSFEEHLNTKYGVSGTPKRNEFDMQSLTFRIERTIKKEA